MRTTAGSISVLQKLTASSILSVLIMVIFLADSTVAFDDPPKTKTKIILIPGVAMQCTKQFADLPYVDFCEYQNTRYDAKARALDTFRDLIRALPSHDLDSDYRYFNYSADWQKHEYYEGW